MVKKIILGIFIALFVVGCSVKRDAIGEPDQMIIVADSVDWNTAKPMLDKAFAPKIPTPRPEPWYNLQRVEPSQFEQFMDYKNIIIFSLLREGSPSRKFIDRTFSKSLVQAMQSGEQTVALKHNPWRKNQLLLILTAPTFDEMQAVMENRGTQLRGYFDEKLVERQKEYLYKRYEQKKIENKLQQKYDWSFRVPRDWVVIHDRPDSNFYWIGRNLPIRWVSVYWEKADSTVTVDSTIAVHLRQKVGEQMYGDIATNPDYLSVEPITLDGQPAIRVRGIWAHHTEAKGGPFTGAAYYDPDTNRLFYIDGQIFAPDMNKLLYIRQEEIMISTFTSGQNSQQD